MDNSTLNDKSYRVLEILSQGKEFSQREVAQKAGLSLGMVNLILRRLIKTGYIKISSLNRKKMEYILTTAGLAERMARSYEYFKRAYSTFHESQSRLDTLLGPLLQKGHRKFVVVGDGEIAELVEMTLRERGGAELDVRRTSGNGFPHASDQIVLDCRLGRNGDAVGVSVLEEILSSSSAVKTPVPTNN